jgi:peptidyl-prolyl cis-trans isomerase C
VTTRFLLAAPAALVLGLAATLPASAQAPAPAAAPSTVVAKVNGRAITEAEMRLADAEIGSELGTLPNATKRRVLIEYLVENQLMADAATGAKLDSGPAFDERLAYWRRRALRDSYFASAVENGVSDAEAKSFYDAQVSGQKAEEEIKARHILVESQEKAKEVFEKIAYGADFAKMAREYSKDPGTKDDGGDLGFFSRGQMVPQFEEAAFKLDKGDVSLPVETQFGWHLIQVLEKRARQAPDFESVKPRIKAALVHHKAQDVVTDLRAKAAIEYIDPAVKAQVEAEKKGPAPKR